MKHSIPFGLLVVCALVSGCTVSGTARVAQPDNSVWVCHNARWQRVSANAAEGHQRHGDIVSQTPQPRGERCGGGENDRGRDHQD
ncbi:MAG: hypothetical protein ABSB58_01430 [Gemmatimonadales bacterium]|jgi:outer membrane biogenesis lipoprotein LolB